MSSSSCFLDLLPFVGNRTRRRSVGVAFALVVAIAGLPFESADAASIVSWDNDNQRGGDLFYGHPDLGYQTFRSTLINRGHTVLPGLATLTASDLTGVNVFFWGTSDHVLDGTEQGVLFDFIDAGGLLILETDSTSASDQPSANSAYAALGIGAIDPVFDGDNTANQGTFFNVESSTTVSLFADLRGETWGGTNSPSVPVPGPGGGVVLGTVGSSRKWVEYAVGSGGGGVLGVADPYGFDIFTNSASGPYYNQNNLPAYLNFIENAAPVPEPGTGLLISLGLVGFAASRRRNAHRS